ncbi:putative iron-sulfur cluster binding protein [Trichodesmium erythraeum IMS101]|uniref:Epoxyqueuosine reductase n=1 Tax=Trichodesmium erythraeum (strain IMS101) TaxID=203124 RepID=Q10VF8_TRIEI|nr:tRNA epoxyqueuosine(34) reductase QueG [Trichodesmium erythraeum GBRTRLIN201]MDE5093006.1 tRNA epoxyqueuosine(34) reductase QueG [Trichodesmium sp. St11_bin5]
MKLYISSSQIKQKALEVGFHKVGITSANKLSSEINRLQSWLNKGYQADLEWMANPKRQDLKKVMPEVKSVICVALNYYTPHKHSESSEIGKISRYGWGRDYHKVMHKKLKSLVNWLQEQDQEILTRYYVDTGPIMEKPLAEQAGVGWIAKNGNLITREYGSWVFLGEVLTNLELTNDRPHTEHCGSCTRCLEACPTNAIVESFVIDANLCIAYHTIENRNPKLPVHIKSNLKGWVAGCDICQDVCPWNQRFAQETNIDEFQPYPNNLVPKLTKLAEISQEDWNKQFPASALRRIKPEMLQRNARANLE